MCKFLKLLLCGVLGLGMFAMEGCGKSVEPDSGVVAGSLSILPTPVALLTDQTVALTAVQTSGPDSSEDVTQNVVWESSSADSLPITNAKATCKKAGIYKITASTVSLSQSASVTCSAPTAPSQPPASPTPTPPAPTPSPVPAPTTPTPSPAPTAPTSVPTSTNPALTAIALMNPPIIIRSNVPYTLTVKGTYADSSTSDVTSQAAWQGDNVARVSSSGTVYCNAAGTTTITATVGAYTSAAKLQCLMKQITGPPGFAENAAKFYGPFPSWLNLKDFGAVGDGVADDTQALQSAISAAKAQFKTLWAPRGRYRITGMLKVSKSDGISIIGEDPRNTEIFWDGPVGGEMISFDGSTHFRVARISWNCNKQSANIGIHIAFINDGSQYYPTYDAIEDSKVSQCGTGINPEYAGETTVNRVHFDQNQYGVNLENWNALNFNVTDSLFTDNAVGLSNTALAGAFNVSNSVFVRSTVADMQMGNTLPFGIRHNLSVGSNMFFKMLQTGASATVTMQGNTVVDTTAAPIFLGNGGPLTLIDNTFNMSSNPTRPVVVAANWSTAYVLAVGNSYTTPTPYQAQAGTIKVTSYDEAPQATLPAFSLTIPTEVYVPPASTSPVIEVTAGGTSDDLQNAVNDAARISGGGTVHVPASTLYLDTTVETPDVPGLVIVGDGLNTDLRPGQMLLGPLLHTNGSVQLESIFISGSSSNPSLNAEVNDQPSTRILCDSCITVNIGQSMSVSGLDHAMINTRTSILGGKNGMKLMGGANQARGIATLGRMDAFMTVSDTYNISAGGHFLISDGWHDGGQSSVQGIVSGNSMVTHEGGAICVDSPTGLEAVGLTGQLSVIGTQIMTAVAADAASTGTVGWLGSITGAWANQAPSTQLVASGSGLNVVHAADIIETPDGIGPATKTPSAVMDIERALSQSRTEFVIPREPLANPATLVRIHRVMFGDASVGMLLSSNQRTAGTGTYSIADPSGAQAPTSCSAGTLSLAGTWSLVPGGDGFYGLLRGGAYLTNSISATDGSNSLSTIGSMMDAGQRWLMQPAGDGLFRVVNRADGSFLTRTASGCATTSPAPNDLSQEWTLTAN